MPATHIALIRGINVGRAKRVAMADLRSLVEGLGYGGVRTLLNSGNIVFTSPRAAAAGAASRIEKAMAARLRVSARVIVLSASEVKAIINGNPLLGIASNPSRLMAAVLGDPKDRARLGPLVRQDWAPDALALGPRVAYLWCAEGLLESRLAVAVQRALGDCVTLRNWATMTKLHALAATR